MTESLYQLADDTSNTGLKVRHRNWTVGANSVYEPWHVPGYGLGVRTFRGMVGAFRTHGSAGTPQGIFILSNASTSAVYVAVRSLLVYCDSTALLATVTPKIITQQYTGNPTVAGGATAQTKVPVDSTLTSDSAFTVLGALSEGAASAMTVTGGTIVQSWTQLTQRQHTLENQVFVDGNRLIPGLAQNDPVILRPGIGEGLFVQVIAVNAADNPITTHYVLSCAWDELTIP